MQELMKKHLSQSDALSVRGAQVAVLDSDEVYHFFDMIPTFSQVLAT
jgi:hypothetical protein